MQALQRYTPMVICQVVGLGIVRLPREVGSGKRKNRTHDKLVGNGDCEKPRRLFVRNGVVVSWKSGEPSTDVGIF